jgi:hypothetical protein
MHCHIHVSAGLHLMTSRQNGCSLQGYHLPAIFRMSSNIPLSPLDSNRTFGEFLCSDPELFVFRRFELLNARALLYMQSELICLESRLHEFDQGDEKDGSHDAMLPAVCFETILSRSSANNPREVDRLQLIRRIQDITLQYSAWAYFSCFGIH